MEQWQQKGKLLGKKGRKMVLFAVKFLAATGNALPPVHNTTNSLCTYLGGGIAG